MNLQDVMLDGSEHRQEPIKDVLVTWQDGSTTSHISREVTLMFPQIVLHNDGVMEIINSDLTKTINIEERGKNVQ